MIDFDDTVLAASMESFGEHVIWIPADAASAKIPAIFFDGVKEIKFQDAVEVVETVSSISVRAVLFSRAPVADDAFRIRGRFYVATEIDPDGVGGINIKVRLANDSESYRGVSAPHGVA